ncbi:thioredoxin domain-containing protein [Chironomus tepperi]|uniref:thioredoxin domain-containing protein n=1 Tax=Chironomus tepperi TaxID=113505 RepID=UPI00391F3B62
MIFKLLILIISISCINSAALNTVSDDTLLDNIREHKYILILFAKKNCGQDCKYEQSVVALKEEFENTFNEAKILKVENSQLVRLYNPIKKEPALVFLRQGVPLIYDENDPDTADDIFNFFSEHRDPIVKELDDTNFEHLTQASTGSTTGDWFVQFYDNSCIDCQRLQAQWETVAAKLKIRMNVARVNRVTKGILTAKRFRVETSPVFILIRQGKFYRYNLKKYDIESFVGFASSWFKSVGAEKVKVPASEFDNLIDGIVSKLKTLPNIKELALNEYPIVFYSAAALIVIFVLLKLFKKGPKEVKTETKKEEKQAKKNVKKEK